MKGQLKHVFKASAIYSIGNLANKVIGFVLLPLYTDYLTTHDYGMLGLLEATGAILVAVLSLRIPTAMIRWCSDTADKEEQRSIVFSSFVSLLALVVAFNILLQPFSEGFSSLFFSKIDFKVFFQLLFLSIGLEILSKVPLEFLRFEEKAPTFIAVNITKLVVVLGLNIYLIAWKGWGVEGILFSQVIGNGLVLLLTSGYLLSNFSFRFNRAAMGEMFRYGFPLIFSTLSAMLLTLADRYILPYFHDYGDLGIYSLAYKIASVTKVFLITSFQLGFLPIAFKRHNEPDFKPFLSKVLTYFTLGLTACTLFISFFSKEIIKTFSKDTAYWDAYNLVPIIGFVFILNGIEYLFTLGFHFTKKTKYNINIVAVGLVVNVVLNLLLIPRYGAYGAAWATVLTGVLTVVYCYRLSGRFYPMDYELGKLYKLLAISIIFVLVLYAINGSELYIRFSLKLILLLAFPVVLWGVGFFDRKEVEAVGRFYRKWRNRWNSK